MIHKVSISVLSFLLLHLIFLSAARAQIVYPNAVQGVTLYGPGQNGQGVSVTYDPLNRNYYSVSGSTVMSNVVTYSETGQQIGVGTHTQIDHRGLWWDFHGEKLMTNGFDSSGVYYMYIDQDNIATDSVVFFSSSLQPSSQSVAAFDWKHNHILYFFGGEIYTCDLKQQKIVSRITVKNLPFPLSYYSVHSLAYTGFDKREILLFDIVNNEVCFINQKDGEYQVSSKLPPGTATQLWQNYSYSNGQVFIRNGSNWEGFKVASDCHTLFPNLASDTIKISCGEKISVPEAISPCFGTIYAETTNDLYYSEKGIYKINWTFSDPFGNTEQAQQVIQVDPPEYTVFTTSNGLVAGPETATNYNWLKCAPDGTHLLRANDVSFLPSESGYYAVITNTRGCIDTTDCTYFSRTTFNNGNEYPLTVAPNPGNGLFTVSQLAFSHYQVSDISGRNLFSIDATETDHFTVDLQQYPSGIYFIRSSSGEQQTRLVVVR